MVYNRDPAQMQRIVRFANYWEVYEAVFGPEAKKPTGYELFPPAWDCKKTGAIDLVEVLTDAPFVSPLTQPGYPISWLDSGRDLQRKLVCAGVVFCNPYNVKAHVGTSDPNGRYDNTGAIRMFRLDRL